MNILYLTGKQSDTPIHNFLHRDGNQILEIKGLFEDSLLKTCRIDFIISYGYRYILKKPIVDFMKGRIINLHPSYLPWNRGVHPNFWSWVEDTPKGVSIHFIDEGIDTGNIIVQREVDFEDEKGLNLYDSHILLKEEIEDLFMCSWADIKRGTFKLGIKQEGKGSFHLAKDIEKYWACLTEGWMTKIDTLQENIKNIEI